MGNFMRSYKLLATTLATLSIIPFVLTTYLSLSNHALLGKTGVTLFAIYSGLSLSFISGIIWGRVIELPESANGKRLLISCYILISSAWCALLMNTPELSVVLLLLGFISIYWVENRWLKQSNANKPFLPLHFGLTTTICIMHLLVLYPRY
jgi:hypothetical protein